MVMFNSYVKLPDGNPKWRYFYHGLPIFMGTLGNVTVDCHWLIEIRDPTIDQQPRGLARSKVDILEDPQKMHLFDRHNLQPASLQSWLSTAGWATMKNLKVTWDQHP